MLYISYENQIGKLSLNGGSGQYPWKVIDIEGLGIAEKSLNTASYPSTVGQVTLSEAVSARTITIQCDICCGRNIVQGGAQYGNPYSLRHEVSNALKILNEPGVLVLGNGYTTRKINARCISSNPGERNGGYRVFVMQFICDYPYFEDKEDTAVPISQREKLIEMPFTLPCMFSRRITEADVVNNGDVATEPMIIITMTGDCADSGTIQLANETTGQMLKVKCQAENGDVITLDIPNRKIYNQKGENLISFLSQESFLSEFWLEKGKNRIKVINDISNSCTVVCKYSNKYIEAVIV